MKHLVLVGGGHSHVLVLLHLRKKRSPGLRVSLVSPEPLMPYSGMLPGVVAGHYAPADAQISLPRLCAAAGAEWIADRVTGLDAERGILHCASGAERRGELISINCGSAPGLGGIAGAADVGVPVKPISRFLPTWEEWLEALRADQSPRELVVVGGGAGGIEMALSLWHRLRVREQLQAPSLSLVTASDSLTPGSSAGLARRLERALALRDIRVLRQTRIVAAQSGELQAENGQRLPADHVFWVTDAGAPDWPRQAGLATDAHGFIRVDPTLRSLSHPHIFAAGDIASLLPEPAPKAGVFAVRQGPVLAANLLRAADGRPLRTYRPQSRFLTLVSTGNRYAVAARGRWSAEGAWVWHWKNWLDRRFVARFRLRK